MAAGRLPGGKRVWKEWQHPRDDRGRFAKKGGAKWASRVLRDADARFADTGASDPTTAIRSGRLPGGVLDFGAVRRQSVERAALASGARRVDTANYGEVSKLVGRGQVLVGRKWHDIGSGGYGNGRNYVGYRDDAGRQQEVTGSILVRESPQFPAAEPVDAEQHDRMAGWERDARKPPAFRKETLREHNIERYRKEIVETEAALKEATRKARARARRKYPEKEGYSKWTRDNYVDDQTWNEQSRLNYAKRSLEHIQNLDDPSMDEAESGYDVIFTGKIDPSRPLAVYGDLLHADAYDQGSYMALRTLETRVPAELHQVVARWMFESRRRNEKFYSNSSKRGEAGIFVGAKPVSQLRGWKTSGGGDDKPRGWGEDKSWDDVNGAVNWSTGSLHVGWTANSQGRHSRTGTESHTALHEFGHALDGAMGKAGKTASKSPEWRALHTRLVADAGVHLSPYFKQAGDAGPEEAWAEAFMAWSRAMSRTKSDTDPLPPIEVRVRSALRSAFGMGDQALANEVHSYFLKITEGAGVKW